MLWWVRYTHAMGAQTYTNLYFCPHFHAHSIHVARPLARPHGVYARADAEAAIRAHSEAQAMLAAQQARARSEEKLKVVSDG